MYTWHSRPHPQGLDFSNPTSGEYFASGRSRNAAAALIREALQNAMDAGRDIDRADEPVRVHIGLYADRRAMAAGRAHEWFEGLRPHVEAPGNGLYGPPGEEEPCPFLIVEDFGTSGLTGDPTATEVGEERNNFIDFMRGDGQTRKQEGDRGSWGVGKNVFPRASRLNGFLAWTIRHDDRRSVAMGKAIYKVRTVGGDQRVPQCYLCADWPDEQAAQPIEQPDFINRLRADFCLARTEEPGLSIIVPYIDPKEIGFDELAEAVAGEYYYAILAGSLEITLTDGERELTFNRDRIIELVGQHASEEEARAQLAKWSLEGPEPLEIERLDARVPQKWQPELVPEPVRNAILDRLQRGDPVAIRVPVWVRPKHGEPQPSEFHVYLEERADQNTSESDAPVYIREQLVVSEVFYAGIARGIRSLVVIDDGAGGKALANLLRDAEPPSHDDWKATTSQKLNANYRGGNHVVTFVKNAVKAIMRAVRQGDEKPDPTPAMDYFSVPDVPESPSRSRSQREPAAEGRTESGVKTPARRPKAYAIDQITGGFRLHATTHTTRGEAPAPEAIDVRVAYDVAQGSPWKQYEPADFDFNLLNQRKKSDLSLKIEKAEWEILASNRLRIRPTGPGFDVRVLGFDTNRDLIVVARASQETIDVDEAAELHQTGEA